MENFFVPVSEEIRDDVDDVTPGAGDGALRINDDTAGTDARAGRIGVSAETEEAASGRL